MRQPLATEFNSAEIEIIILGARAQEANAIIEELEKYSDHNETAVLRSRIKGPGSGLPVFALPIVDPRASDPKVVSVGVIECSDMGNVLSAINTAYAVCRFTPTLAIFSGIAGSLDSERYRIGDVIFPRSIKVREFQKLKTFREDYSNFNAQQKTELLEHVRGRLEASEDRVVVTENAKNFLIQANARRKSLEQELQQAEIPADWTANNKCAARPAAVLLEESSFSWNKVLSNAAYVGYLKGQINNACTTVDMESYGFLKAILKLREANYPTHGIVIRSVSDYAQFKELTDADPKWRNLALTNMAIATRFVIQNVFDKVF